MHVLITGAAGIVGSWTLKHLLEQGHKVIALDIKPIPESILGDISGSQRGQLTTHVLDLVDFRGLEAIIENAPSSIDGLIHIGGIPNPLHHDPRIVHNTNVTTNYNVLQTCAKYGIKRVVQASSINAYGMSFTPPGTKFWDELPMTEKSPVAPADPYATSKICCELQADAICRYYPELRIASLRYHACKEDYKDAASASRAPSLWCWVSLKSCATAGLLGLTSEGWSGHEVFNLVGDEIAWEGELDQEVRYRKSGEPLGSLNLLESAWKGRYGKVDKSYWEGRPRRGFWDCTKAKEVLGWSHDNS